MKWRSGDRVVPAEDCLDVAIDRRGRRVYVLSARGEVTVLSSIDWRVLSRNWLDKPLLAPSRHSMTKPAFDAPEPHAFWKGTVTIGKNTVLFTVIYPPRMSIGLRGLQGSCAFVLDKATGGIRPLDFRDSPSPLLLPPLGDRRSLAAAGGTYYVLALNGLYELSPERAGSVRWVSGLPEGLWGHTLLGTRDTVCMLGGSKSGKHLYAYDANQGNWRSIGRPFMPRVLYAVESTFIDTAATIGAPFTILCCICVVPPCFLLGGVRTP
jgi:hypothetical protein